MSNFTIQASFVETSVAGKKRLIALMFKNRIESGI